MIAINNHGEPTYEPRYGTACYKTEELTYATPYGTARYGTEEGDDDHDPGRADRPSSWCPL
jgi:hypothetical protein